MKHKEGACQHSPRRSGNTQVLLTAYLECNKPAEMNGVRLLLGAVECVLNALQSVTNLGEQRELGCSAVLRSLRRRTLLVATDDEITLLQHGIAEGSAVADSGQLNQGPGRRLAGGLHRKRPRCRVPA